MEPAVACPSCGASGMGRYCVHCGEKRLGAHDRSLRHYLGEAIETFSHFDSKILKTVWWLLRWPGRLSADYLEGCRVRFVNPLRLFLLSSIIYFLFNSLFPYNAFTTPLSVQLHMNNYYPQFAAAEVAKSMRHHGIDFAALEQAYNTKTAVLSKTLVFSLIPVIALLLNAFLFRRRRYFAEHLVVATHFWSFALLLIGVFIPLLLLLLTRLAAMLHLPPGIMTADSVPTIIIQVVFAAYVYAMLRRAYQASRWYCGLLALLMAWSFFHIVWLFRFLLFEVTIHTL